MHAQIMTRTFYLSDCKLLHNSIWIFLASSQIYCILCCTGCFCIRRYVYAYAIYTASARYYVFYDTDVCPTTRKGHRDQTGPRSVRISLITPTYPQSCRVLRRQRTLRGVFNVQGTCYNHFLINRAQRHRLLLLLVADMRAWMLP